MFDAMARVGPGSGSLRPFERRDHTVDGAVAHGLNGDLPACPMRFDDNPLKLMLLQSSGYAKATADSPHRSFEFV